MTHHKDGKEFDPKTTRHVIDVAAHCRKNGLDKEEEQRLVTLFGRFATRHELHMNAKRPPPNGR